MEPLEEHITNVCLISVIMYGVGEVFSMWFCFPCAIPNNKVKKNYFRILHTTILKGSILCFSYLFM